MPDNATLFNPYNECVKSGTIIHHSGGMQSRVRKTSPSNMDSKEQRKYSSTDNLALEFILLMIIVLL